MLYLGEDWALDCSRRELRRSGTAIAVEPKVFDVLHHLIRNRDRVVGREELIASVWEGRIVSESALATCINAARAVLGDSGGSQRLIRTLPRKGFRFVGSVREDLPAAAPLALPQKPSIAVLPFQNLSTEPDQDYFIDGVVDDIITGLSRIRWLFVIARNSSFAYKNKALDIKQVGRELGVRYVLEGALRKAARQMRVTVQLLEAETATHLWAERYDRVLEDLFALQDEITMSVVGAIEPQLRKVELERVKRKRPESLDAYDLVLRATPYAYSHIAEDALHAIPLLKRALELEPGYASAHALLAWCYHFRYSRAGLKEEDRSAAIHHARAAITAGSDDASALGMAGFVFSLDAGDQTTALDLFDRALALSNSNIFGLACSALVLAWMGHADRAIERAERALRLSPFDFLNYLSYNALAIAHFHSGRYEAALRAARCSVQLNARFSVSHVFLAGALIAVGREEEAAAEAQLVLSLDPAFTIRRWSVTVGIEPTVFEPLAAAWRKAGLP